MKFMRVKMHLEVLKAQIDKSAKSIRHGCNGAEKEEAIAMI